MLKILLPVCAVGIVLLSCGRKNETDNSKVLAASKTAITNEADLQRYLVPGLPTNMIVARFGVPNASAALNDGYGPRQNWLYFLPPFPARDTTRGTMIGGFSVDITNGCLARWECIYTEPPMGAGKEIAIGGNSREAKNSGQRLPVLKLFIVSSNATTGSQFIDTKEFPKLGYIPSNAAIETDELKDLRLEETLVPESGSQSHKHWIFYVDLTLKDAGRFQTVTEDNNGTVMLMTIDDIPLFAVYIRESIHDGLLRIDMTNEATMEMAKQEFARMSREGQ